MYFLEEVQKRLSIFEVQKRISIFYVEEHLVFRAFEVYTLDTVAHTLEGHLSLFEKII